MHSLLLQGKKVSALWDACGLDNRGREGFDEDSYCIRSNTVPVDRGTRWAMAVNEGAFCTCGLWQPCGLSVTLAVTLFYLAKLNEPAQLPSC